MQVKDRIEALAADIRREPGSYDLMAGALLDAMLSEIREAQLLVLEPAASHMLFDLVREMAGPGGPADSGHLPFDHTYVEILVPGEGAIGAAVRKTEDGVEVRVATDTEGGPLQVNGTLTRIGHDGQVETDFEYRVTSAYEYPNPEADEQRIGGDRRLATGAYVLLCALGVLRQHDDVVRETQTPLHSRQQRRAAARAGRVLPDRKVTRITLGEIGKRHLEAMQDEGEGGKRRAHWVRGHLFIARNGRLTWRRPHVRGHGPVQKTVRVIGAEDTPSP